MKWGIVFITNILASIATGDEDLLLRMPQVQVTGEIYLCTSVKISKKIYIKEFIPETESAHHMLVFGCNEVKSEEEAWRCVSMDSQSHMGHMGHNNEMGHNDAMDQNDDMGQMGRKGHADRGKRGRQPSYGRRRSYREGRLNWPCSSDEGARILYSWSHGGDKFTMPDGVSTVVDGDDRPYYLVLNAHYHAAQNKSDSSGVRISYSEIQTPKSTGLALLSASKYDIPFGASASYVDCLYTAHTPIHVFAFRVHTHDHGTNVAVYRIRNKKSTLIAERDPQLPQTFVKLNESISLEKYDVLKLKCEMMNTDTENLGIGSSVEDEMCNMYVLFWLEKPDWSSFISCSN